MTLGEGWLCNAGSGIFCRPPPLPRPRLVAPPRDAGKGCVPDVDAFGPVKDDGAEVPSTLGAEEPPTLRLPPPVLSCRRTEDVIGPRTAPPPPSPVAGPCDIELLLQLERRTSSAGPPLPLLRLLVLRLPQTESPERGGGPPARPRGGAPADGWAYTLVSKTAVSSPPEEPDGKGNHPKG